MTEYDTYLGPYIIANNPEVPTTIKKRGCLNKKCPMLNVLASSEYCPKCGKQIGEYSLNTTASKIDSSEMTELDDFWRAECDIDEKDVYINNEMGRTIETGDVGLFQVTAKMIISELSLFKQRFAKEIEFAEKVYGQENISVEWGINSTRDLKMGKVRVSFEVDCADLPCYPTGNKEDFRILCHNVASLLYDGIYLNALEKK
jgi:hypothetical protein